MTTIAQLHTPAGSSRPDGARTKLVIRRLPPTLPEEIFWKSVATWISEDSTTWKQYIEGHKGDEHDGHAVFSRAYVLFKSPEAVLAFRQAYDGHVFRSKTGEEYQAVVEFSPIQRTPLTAKVKVDPRQGTIDDDSDYISFLEGLKMPTEKAVIEVSAPIAQPTSTPLLDHLRIHGRGGKGAKKQQTTASSSDARGRAIASVTAAAAKRAPNADTGPKLVAGKGREVTIAENVPAPAPAAGGGKKRDRGKKKDKAHSADTPDGSPATSHASQQQTPSTSAHQTLPSRPPKAPKQRQDRAKVDQNSSVPPVGVRADGEGAGRETRHVQGRISRRGDGAGDGAVGAEGESGGGVGAGGRGRGGRGARRGGGGERGAGGGDGKDRLAKAAVVSILARNSETKEGRGGGPGRGRGRGGGPPPTMAATARIDD